MTPVNPSDEAPRGEGMTSLEISGSDAPATSLGRHADSSKIAYQLPQPMRMVANALIVAALAPGSAIAGVWFKPQAECQPGVLHQHPAGAYVGCVVTPPPSRTGARVHPARHVALSGAQRLEANVHIATFDE